TQNHYNRPKQQDRNLEIALEDIEIDPYHLATKDQDMTPLIEEVNREIDQDLEVIQNREIIKVQEKLKWISIEIRIYLKPETGQEIDAVERIEEEANEYDNRNREEGQDDNPNDEWTKRTQMQKDPPENHNDRYLTWTKDIAPQHLVATPQPKQPVQQTQRVKQVQVQPKQQAPAQIPIQRGRK
ncbi:MAG: hypothetical protein EZS28_054466, partial [Streblomastix strix]